MFIMGMGMKKGWGVDEWMGVLMGMGGMMKEVYRDEEEVGLVGREN
ncbi:monooxygenase family protein [Bacillus pumilus]